MQSFDQNPPKHLTLLQGQTEVSLFLRPIQPKDAAALQAHHRSLSTESVFYRFFGIKKELSDTEARSLCNLDGVDQAAIVAVKLLKPQSNELKEPTADQPVEEIEGVARYFRTAPQVAEMAIVVRDAYQGYGLGKALLKELIPIAQGNNINCLEALVLSENWHMHHLLHELGYVLTSKVQGSEVLVQIHLDEPENASLKV